MNPIYANKSAYVALICLIAFVVVITICIIKQFIWDPLLSKSFETLRPVLSESVRRISSNFLRVHSNEVSRFSLLRSVSDACLINNNPSSSPSPPNLNPISVTHSLPITDNQSNPLNKSQAPRSYGSSSSNTYVYTNYASDVLTDEYPDIPLLHFHCEYDPSTREVKLTVDTLRHMRIFRSAIRSETIVRIRIRLSSKNSPPRFFETTAQAFDDMIVFNQTFVLFTDIHSGDRLNSDLEFFVLLFNNGNIYEIAEGIHSLTEDCLTYVSFIERTITMHLKFIEMKKK